MSREEKRFQRLFLMALTLAAASLFGCGFIIGFVVGIQP